MKKRALSPNITSVLKVTVLLAMVLSAMASPQAAHAAALCLVDKDAVGFNNGTSWANAYTNLQTALGNVNCTVVWVAEGAYKPGTLATDTFTIPPGVKVWGGFSGTETMFSQRDPAAHVTILSGDVDNNDTNVDGNNIDETTADIYAGGANSYHVVTIDGRSTDVTSTTILDGFTITGGQAKGGGDDSNGAGLYCHGENSGNICSPTLSHLRFMGNLSTVVGGGLFDNGTSGGTSSPTVAHVVFSGNNGGNYGGAMRNDANGAGTSSPTLTDVTFSNNTAADGGAISDNGGTGGTSSPSLSLVAFTDNTATFLGGAIYGDAGTGAVSSPSLTNVGFDGNSAESGGAMYNRGFGSGVNSPTLTGVSFYLNSATAGDGGAMVNFGWTGGTSSPMLTNVTFYDNQATGSGGAMLNMADGGGTSSPGLTNVTISGSIGAGALYNTNSASTVAPTLTNVILWGDAAGEIANNGATPSINHSVVQGSGGSGLSWSSALGTDGGGNIDADPLLMDFGFYGGPTRTLPLRTGSSAIDTADGAASPATDQRGVPRPQRGGYDIGAFELRGYSISGNTGIGGALLTYNDGGWHQVDANGSGDYYFAVPPGWSGTVVPFETNYCFAAASTTYSNVQTDQASQNFTATACATTGSYDDADSGWTHTGAWTDISIAGPFDNTLGIIASAGSTASFPFFGDRFTLHYLQYTGWGKIGVYLDGGATPMATIDTNGAANILSYDSPVLDAGAHVVTLKNAGPAGAMVGIDELDIQTPAVVGAGTYDDADTAWSYSSGWAPLAISGPFDNTLQIGASMGSSTTLLFHGSGFSLTYLQYTGWGNIAVYLDGSPTALTTINTNGPAGLPTYISPTLIPADHVLKLVHAGPAGTFIGTDAITITP